MWKNPAEQDNQQKSGSRLILPALCDCKGLSLSSPQPQRDQVLKLNELFLSLQGNNISRIPLAIRNTMGHLTSRHMEVSHWQALIYESIRRVEREVGCVEQVKEMAEHCLQERQLYSQLMSDCVALSSSLCSAGLRQDQVFIKLKKEEQLNNESREVLQKQIVLLLDKLSSLKTIRSRLQVDFQDKMEAIKLTTRCITFEVETPCSYFPAGPLKPIHVSYEKWLSHCQYLKLTADNLVKDSSSCRGNLQFLMANIRNTNERQRCSTGECLRRKIHELTKINDNLKMDRQRIKHEISDLTKDMQRVANHIQNCDSRLHQTSHLLDILNQRPRLELCLDHPHNYFTLERQDLATMVAGLQSALQRSQQNLGVACRHLTFIEDRLARNTEILEVAKRCQSLHQSFRLAVNTAVVLSNRPRLCGAAQSSSPHTDLQ
ncbi:tektin-2-like [Fundulus diaphanus]